MFVSGCFGSSCYFHILFTLHLRPKRPVHRANVNVWPRVYAKKKCYYVLGYAVKIWAIYYVHSVPNNKIRIKNSAVKKHKAKTNMLQYVHLKKASLYFYSRGQQIAAIDLNMKRRSASINRKTSRRRLLVFLSFCQEVFSSLFIPLFTLIYSVIEM